MLERRLSEICWDDKSMHVCVHCNKSTPGSRFYDEIATRVETMKNVCDACASEQIDAARAGEEEEESDSD